MTKQFSAKVWVDNEIFQAMDLYDNTRHEAIDWVLDMLSEDQYDDELSPDQVALAREELVKIHWSLPANA